LPKPSIQINEDIIRLLSFEISLIIGFRIRSKADCKALSAFISKKGFGTISVSTLYRLLVWKNNTHTPYLHTLDILARVCGRENWAAFELFDDTRREYVQNLGNLAFKNKPSLLHFVIRNGNFEALSDYLRHVEGTLKEDQKFLLGLEVYNALAKMNDNKAFFDVFARNKEIRTGFFEYLADPDFNLNDYDYGLEKYLEASNSPSTTIGLQDRMFAHSLLLRWFFLNNNHARAKHHGRELYEELIPSDSDWNQLHIFPKARYQCYKLFYFQLTNEKEKFDDQVKKLLKQFALKTLSTDEKRMLFHTIIDTFSYLPMEYQSYMRQRIFKEFKELFMYLPENFREKSFKDLAPYFSKNATDWYRFYGLITHEA
jgi:hypothetical protein